MGKMRYVKLTAGLLVLGGALVACRHEFESPYLPGSPGYAGDDWTRDGDHNGVADSLDKYSPGCLLPPKQCIDNAKIISKIPPGEDHLLARDMLLWVGDTARSPNLEWSPAEGVLRGYLLTSSNPKVASIVGGKVLADSVGSAMITVTVPGMEILATSFIAKVVAQGKRVESISAKDLTLQVGQDTSAMLTWVPADADYQDYSLTSDRPDIARIIGGQKIRGVFAGKTTIAVQTMDGARKTAFSVTVASGPEVIYASSITADPMYLVKDGGAQKPNVRWYPAGVTDRVYKLLPILESVKDRPIDVTADSQSIVPLAAGSCEVLIIALDGSGKASNFTVTVSASSVPVQGLKATDLNVVLDGGTVQPRLTWIPADATNRKYTLSSSDQTVALPSSGMIDPIGLGVADFTATSDDGAFSAVFKVTVGRPDTAVHVDSVQVAALSLAIGEEHKITPVLYPANAGNSHFTLACEDTTVAGVSGEKLKGLKKGTTNVRLTMVDGGRTADFKVTVYAPTIPVQMVTVDSMSTVVGTDAGLSITWTPSNASNLNYTLVSQDTNVVTIMNGTRVYGKSVGNAKVTLRSADGPTATFQVLVNAKAVHVTSISAANFQMNLGDTKDPALVFYPASATDKSYTLKAAAGSTVIGISGSNRVVANAPGKAPLTVTPNDNPAAAVVCTVTVVAIVKSITALDDTLRIGAGDKDATPKFTFDPANATSKEFQLKADDTTMIKVSASGKAYRGLRKGKSNVVVKALDGSGKADTFSVVVILPVVSMTVKDYTMKATDTVLFSTTPLFTWVPDSASNKNWTLIYTYPNLVPAPSTVVLIKNGWQLLAQGPGTASIVAISLDNWALRDTFTVTVTQPVTGITAANVTMKLGDPDVAPTITILPANATDKGWVFGSLSTSIATVVAGKIHAVTGGVANFGARSTSDTTKYVVFTVTVSVPVTSVTAADLSVRIGEGAKDPVLTWNPATATNKGYTLTSTNTGIVSINANKVQGVAPGVANVIISTTDGNKLDTFAVTSIQPVASFSAADMAMRLGDADRDPTITWNPVSATNKNYTLSGGATGIATVVSNRVHAAGGGTANIIVTSTDNGKLDTFVVTVAVPVDGIQGQGFTMKMGDEDVTPTITITPTNASNKGWYLVSKDETNATIVGGTHIHAVSRGDVDIVVVSSDNDKITDTFKVTIKNAFGF